MKPAGGSRALRPHGNRPCYAGTGVKVERMRGRLSGGNRASRLYFDEGWTIYDVSLLLGHADVKTTERYIGADQKKRLHELVAKRALTLVK
jgi:integrase